MPEQFDMHQARFRDNGVKVIRWEVSMNLRLARPEQPAAFARRHAGASPPLSVSGEGWWILCHSESCCVVLSAAKDLRRSSAALRMALVALRMTDSKISSTASCRAAYNMTSSPA